ncbi:zinc knuckle [Colletotrichum higginsianum]|nr:zinc knuckle [Colletotrichum higginsianum]
MVDQELDEDGELVPRIRRVAFYLHRSIDLNSWKVEFATGKNSNLVATLTLNTQCGDVMIHNAYNPTGQLNFDELMVSPTTDSNSILLGDFNLHHKRWAVQKSNLVFAGSHLKGDRLDDCAITPLRIFEHTDHRVVRSVFKVGPRRDLGERLLWKKCNQDKFEETASDLLKHVARSEMNTTADIDVYVQDLLGALKDTIKKHVAKVLRKPHRPAFKPPSSSEIDKSRAKEESALRAFRGCRRRGRRHGRLWIKYNAVFRSTSYHIHTEKTREWREIAANRTAVRPWAMAKQSLKWCGSRETTHMPRLKKPDGSLCRDDAENAVCFRQSIWPETSTGGRPDPLPLPNLPPGRAEHDSSPIFDEDEVSKVCRGLEYGKGCGPDGVPSDAIKYAKAPLIPHLALEYLLTPIYKSFIHPGFKKAQETFKWLCTLLSLDIAGAYDHVRCQELLRILADKGIPAWIIHYVRSFLSARRSRVHFPGFVSDDFWVNIGIPQGSPLSPILFVFFTSPMLEKFKQENPAIDIVIAMSYVDDTYILVTSPSYKTNCEILTKWHDVVMGWAGPIGIRFDPSKYQVMHFRRSRTTSDYPDDMPAIVGLTKKNNLVPEERDPADENGVEDKRLTHLRILGLLVDHRLSWDAHIAHIEARVRAKMSCYNRISGSTWGVTLIDMRRLYYTSVRTIIAYAAPVWFVHFEGCGSHLQIRQKLVHKLQVLQNFCLRQISGAFRQTASMVLHKELHIDPIAIYLQRIAMSHRLRTLNTQEHKRLMESQQQLYPGMRSTAVFDAHPYKKAYDLAEAFLVTIRAELYHVKFPVPAAEIWGNSESRNEYINDYAERQASTMSGMLWDQYLNRRNKASRTLFNVRPVAAKGEWRKENLECYEGLKKAQSTILIQCRTGVIGLNSFLKQVKLSETDMCPCGTGVHTVSHLLYKCPSLAEARVHHLPLFNKNLNKPDPTNFKKRAGIRDKPGKTYKKRGKTFTKPVKPNRKPYNDLTTLLTDHAHVVTEWAIRHFGLEQFEWTNQHLLIGPSKKYDSLFEGT